MSPALSFFSQYPNLHNSYVNCFIDSFNCKRDASSVLMEYCPESCIWKVKYLCINGIWYSLLIHGFSLVNARLLKVFDTAFYAIIDVKCRLAGDHLYEKLLFTWLSLVMSLLVSFCAVLFPTGCLGWDLRLDWVSFWGISYLLLQYHGFKPWKTV